MGTDDTNDENTEITNDPLTAIRDHREAVETHLADREDDLGSIARILLALCDGEHPDPDDLDALGFAGLVAGDSGENREFSVNQRRLTAGEVARMAERVLGAVEPRE